MNDHQLLERARALGASDLSIDEVSLLVQRAMESEEFRDALGDIPGVPERLADWQQNEQRCEQDEKIRDFPVQAVAAAGTVFVMVVFGMTWLLVARPWETASQPSPATPAIAKEDPPKPPVVASPPVAVPKPAFPAVAIETPVAPFPWDEQLTRQPRSFADVWPDQLDSQHPVSTGKDLREWFAPVTAHDHRIQDLNFGRYRVGEMRGIVRLKAPLAEGVALRIVPEKMEFLKIHLFHGNDGVTLSFGSEQESPWTAFRTTRTAGGPLPAAYELISHDEGKVNSTELRHVRPLLLMHYDGQVLLTRGEQLLLHAPLANRPEEIFFEQQTTMFRGLELVRLSDGPALAKHASATQDLALPGKWSWKKEGETSAEVSVTPTEAVELFSNKTDQQKLSCVAPIDLPDVPHYLELELSGLSAGAGIILSTDDGSTPLSLIYGPGLQGYPVFATKFNEFPDPGARLPLAPKATERVWLRLLMTPGELKCWQSSTGHDWFSLQGVLSSDRGKIQKIGLVLNGKSAHQRIRLHKASVQPLTGIGKLAGPPPQSLPEGLTDAKDYQAWRNLALAAMPEDDQEESWLGRCAMGTLTHRPPIELGHQLVLRLLDGATHRDLPAAAMFAALDDATRLTPFAPIQDDPKVAALVERYWEVGRRAWQAGDRRPFSLVRPALLDAPFSPHVKMSLLQGPALYDELTADWVDERWPEAMRLCRELRLYVAGQKSAIQALSFAWWVEGLAMQHVANVVSAKRLIVTPDQRNPLLTTIDKEAYNVSMELLAALNGEAYHDACRIISSPELTRDLGVIPSVGDTNLDLSLSLVFELASEQHPELLTTMRELFGDIAQLRVRQAMAQEDRMSLLELAKSFPGTDAAALAWQWLGDHHLSAGRFHQALHQYQQAKKSAPPSSRVELAGRIRLTGALMGQQLGQPLTRPLHFTDRVMAVDEVEALVAELTKARANQPKEVTAPFSLPPTRLSIMPYASLEGDFGRDTGELPSGIVETDSLRDGRMSFDWRAHQLATVVDDRQLYVSTRSQVTRFDLKKGKLVWQTTLGNTPAKITHWPLVSMKPLVVESRLFVRYLGAQGPQLYCVEIHRGNKQWVSKSPKPLASNSGWLVVSDPVWFEGHVRALVVQHVEQSTTLLAVRFDPESGAILRQTKLAKLSAAWWDRRVCQTGSSGDLWIVQLGGATLAVDRDDQVIWRRRSPWVNSNYDGRVHYQQHQPPLIAGGKVFLAQPGMPTIECVDLETGVLHWRATTPSIRRLVGSIENRLLLEVASGWIALDRDTGQVAWRRAAPHRTSFAMLEEQNARLVYASLEPLSSSEPKDRAHMVWLDVANGEQVAATPLPALTGHRVRLGPVVDSGDVLWGFGSIREVGSNRELLKFQSGEALSVQAKSFSVWD